MSGFPTILSPWFLVQRQQMEHDGNNQICFLEFYASAEDGDGMWVREEKKAMLFSSLASAARIATSEGAHVRVLTTKDEVREFGRG